MSLNDSPARQAGANPLAAKRLLPADYAQYVAAASPDILYIFDLKTRVTVYSNRSVSTLLGYPSNTAPSDGETFLRSVMHPDDLAQLPRWMRRYDTARDKEIIQTEYRLKHADDSWRWFQSSSSIFSRAPDGTPLQVVGSTQDITPQKEVEQRLRTANHHLEALYRASPDMIAVLGEDGRFLDINSNLLQVFGYTREQMLTLAPRKIMGSPIAHEVALENIRRAMLGNPIESEWVVRRADGKEFLVDVRLRSLPVTTHTDRTEQAVLMVMRNITARKNFERMLESAATGLSARTGEDYLRSLVSFLTQALDVEIAYIGELAPDNVRTLRTKVVHAHGKLSDNFEYEIAGSPCEQVMGRAICSYPNDVQARFPNDLLLQDLNIQSYIGAPLYDSHGCALGVIAVLNTSPIRDAQPVEWLLRVFAARAAAELERKHTEDVLFAETERAQITLHSIGDAVISTDAQGRIDYLNPVAEKLTGWTHDQAWNSDAGEVFRIVAATGEKIVKNPAQLCLLENCERIKGQDVFLLNREGVELPVEFSATPLRNRRGKIAGSVIVFRDVSEQKKLRDQLAFQASHDPLTQLANRREFEFRLTKVLHSAKERNEDHAVLYLDLDQFKIINDTCGHTAGDELLRQIAVLLNARVRDTDTIARLGGDEFGVLVEHCSLQQAQRLADDIRKAISAFRFVWQEKIFDIGVSIGVVPITPQCQSVAELLGAADVACYAAKDDGRNRVHVYQKSDVDLAFRHGQMHWVTRINRAFKDNRFRLYHQRIVPTHSDRVDDVCYEVLVRILDENDVLILPGAFISAAERFNLMPQLDRWVIHNYFEMRAQQQDTGKSPLFFINISGATLGDELFHDYVREQFREYGVDPNSVCFEFTETAAISNLQAAVRFIKELKLLGCRFSLDDFGSSVSSFTYLKTLPVDFLKIDGGFIKDMNNDAIDHAMVNAIHQIGNVMGIKTIAECVEDAAIITNLRDIGVDYAQGFALHRPELLKFTR